MQLIGYYESPFVRRVGVTMTLYGMAAAQQQGTDRQRLHLNAFRTTGPGWTSTCIATI